MNFKAIGDIQIFRPRISSVVSLQNEAELHLRSKFSAGKYTQGDEINAILQHQFGFYDDHLKKYLPDIASLDLMAFVLAQYDESCKLDALAKDSQLEINDQKFWNDLGPKFRRAVKYMAECIGMLSPKSSFYF